MRLAQIAGIYSCTADHHTKQSIVFNRPVDFDVVGIGRIRCLSADIFAKLSKVVSRFSSELCV